MAVEVSIGDLDPSCTHLSALRAFEAFFTFLNWARNPYSRLTVVSCGRLTNPVGPSQG